MGENTVQGKSSVELNLSESTYSLTTIYAAAYAFLDRGYVHLDKKDNTFVVTITSKNAQNTDLLSKEFLDELINQGHYFAQLEKTQEITKLMVERAFFSTDPKLRQTAENEEIKETLDSLEKEGDPELKRFVRELKNESNNVQ